MSPVSRRRVLGGERDDCDTCLGGQAIPGKRRRSGLAPWPGQDLNRTTLGCMNQRPQVSEPDIKMGAHRYQPSHQERWPGRSERESRGISTRDQAGVRPPYRDVYPRTALSRSGFGKMGRRLPRSPFPWLQTPQTNRRLGSSPDSLSTLLAGSGGASAVLEGFGDTG